ncbi:MAG: SDR family NAD(P)-dependent oxidoreductase [Gracilibacteraceae bacterium]|jgi:NAD(P)-dependent dehydrogenase (short-subunit alcohol dehydrogenase family)|nr:SDR family NAD(P)-dependent oxidoreductase [Gracilibacteraceae bacterium]
MANRVWLITGASKGLGYAYTQKALECGDNVIALARTKTNLADLEEKYSRELLYIQTDVTKRPNVFEAVKAGAEHFGKIDIVINNAGIMVSGMVEELSESNVMDTINTNFLGSLWVIQAVTPYLRQQRSGKIIQITSIGGLLSGASSGLYSASKFALEGLCEALSQEASYFGVKIIIVEPGGYWTNLYLDMRYETPIDDYQKVREDLEKQYSQGSIDSLPEIAADVLLKIIEMEDPPLRIILGSAVLDMAIENYEQKIKTMKQYENISRAAEKGIPMPEGYGK